MSEHVWSRIPSGTAYPLYQCRRCRRSVELRRGEGPEVLDRFPCIAPEDQLQRDLARMVRQYQDAARERWTEALHRPLDQVLASIDRLAAAGLLPVCGCPDTVQAVLTDLLTPGRWRAAWGDEPSDSQET